MVWMCWFQNKLQAGRAFLFRAMIAPIGNKPPAKVRLFVHLQRTRGRRADSCASRAQFVIEIENLNYYAGPLLNVTVTTRLCDIKGVRAHTSTP